jgi:hypothetical protein
MERSVIGMKKFLLAFVMVLVMAFPAVADAPVAVVVNGVTLSTPGLLINGSTYVPLRAVSEGLGAKVDWDGSRAIVETAKAAAETMSEPKIISLTGDSGQKAKVEAALQLLKEKSPADYELVCKYAKFIDISEEKTDVLGETFTYTEVKSGKTTAEKIFLTKVLLDKNDNIYTASVIVHEATHLCNTQNKAIFDNRKTDENIAFLRGIATLRTLGASQQVIDEVEYTRTQVIK